MSIGGYNYAHHLPNDTVKYVPYHAEYNQYRVHLHRIQVFFEKEDINELVQRKRSKLRRRVLK
jgi:hypothetical protein